MNKFPSIVKATDKEKEARASDNEVCAASVHY